MKNTFTLLFIFLSSILLHAQAPKLEWQRRISGSKNEIAVKVLAEPNKSFTVLINSSSKDGDFDSLKGYTNVSLFNLGDKGSIIKKYIFGEYSNGADFINYRGDGYYIVGSANGYFGDNDGLLLSLDTALSYQWDSKFGGSKSDAFNSLSMTNDNGFILAGGSNSDDYYLSGSKTRNYSDMWLFKIDSMFAFVGSAWFGGSFWENAVKIIKTKSREFVVIGYTASNDGDIFGFHGTPSFQTDAWFVKIDSIGALVNQRCIGGSLNDRFIDIVETQKGDFMGIINSESNDSDANCNHNQKGPVYDIILIKLNKNGDIVFRKCIGGYFEDRANKILPTKDGGYLIAGYTRSRDGDVIGIHKDSLGSYTQDAWLCKVDSLGNILWQKCLGGGGTDEAKDVQQTSDGGYIVVGSTSSPDGDVTGNKNPYSFDMFDAWIVKLSPETVGIEEQNNSNNLLTLYPNPTQNTLHINTVKEINGSLCLQEISGKQILLQQNFNTNQAIDVANFPKGIYIISLKNNEAVWHGKFVKE
ncbi:MAG: T9SS type A sorting domain-containing protein [Bacteroidetes bacterium]|nr:T9SS type A sorting domain-containing protein [Bacteroidota bacterium]